jgi:hypothetical protein
MDVNRKKEEIEKNGFTIINDIFTEDEIQHMISIIQKTDNSNNTFRKTKDLFAIRQFLKEIPDIVPFVLTQKLSSAITQLFGTDYKVVKSIYFDKPGESNWFVAYHQDLTISVNKRLI